MNTRTMEGLVGARTNINEMNTPMRAYKEARRRGDTETMERAMGYACDFAGEADEYKAEADEGMKEEAKEVREKEKTEREKAVEKRREERRKQEERIEEGRDTGIGIGADTVEVSAEGEALLKNSMDSDKAEPSVIKNDTGKQPVIYTKTGEAGKALKAPDVSISI